MFFPKRRFVTDVQRMKVVILGSSHLVNKPHSRIWHGPLTNAFHSSSYLCAVKPIMLADIGEGITECQIMSWFVKPGDRVQQFDKLCEVQSDKASVEITSRYDGTIKQLHYELDDMAVVGQPLLDIDIEDDIVEANESYLKSAAQGIGASEEIDSSPVLTQESLSNTNVEVTAFVGPEAELNEPRLPVSNTPAESSRQTTTVITPGVRHLLKKLNLDVNDIQGTGKDGRVLKEDIARHQASKPAMNTSPPSEIIAADKSMVLSPVEQHMFKVMSHSVNIPHFTYTHVVDLSALSTLRSRINKASASSVATGVEEQPFKLTPLPFILKAVSQSFTKFPRLNAHLHPDKNTSKQHLLLKGSHDFGIAVDTPQGLLVPVIRNVQDKSIREIAAEIGRLSDSAKAGRLSVGDLQGATFTVSNIGSIGGAAVSPVIVGPQVGILGIGRVRVVPAFKATERGDIIVKKEEVTLSWSADHRVLDGATVARCAEMLGKIIESMDHFTVELH